MADISKITLPSGSTYDIKDATARQSISDIQSSITGAMHYRGVTTTALTDGSTTATITIDDASVTFGASDAGSVVIYSEKEYVWNGTKWQEFGSTGSLKALAFKDSASGSFTPGGSVSQPTFTGESSEVTITAVNSPLGNYTPSGLISQPTFTGHELTSTGTYTPSGSVNIVGDNNGTRHPVGTQTVSDGAPATYTPAGTINLTLEPNRSTVYPVTGTGTLPSLTTTVENENLTIGWSAGSKITLGTGVSAITGFSSASARFSGTAVRLATVPIKATFTGAQKSVSVKGTPAGTVSKSTFEGSTAQISGTVTPSGIVSQPTFTGTENTVTVS